MKLFGSPKYLTKTITPLVILKYLLGLRIFEYPRGKLRTLLSLIYLLFMLSFRLMTVYEQHKFYKMVQLLQLEHIMYELIVYVCSFIVVCEMLLGFFHTKQLNACYRKIDRIDDTLRQLGSMFNYRGIYFFTVGIIIVLFLLILISSIITIIQIKQFTNLSSLIWLIMSMMYEICISFVVIFEFLIFVKCLQTRFKLVNELLREGATVTSAEEMKLGFFAVKSYAKNMDAKQHQHILSIKKCYRLKRQQQSRVRIIVSRKCNLVKSRTQFHISSELQKQFRMELQGQSAGESESSNLTRRSILIEECTQKRKHFVQTIKQVHLGLCRISKALCTIFGIQIISEIGISITVITVFMYNIYSRVVIDKYNISKLVEQLFIGIILGIINILKIFVINRVCKDATNEGKKTNEIIHSIYGSLVDIDIREEVHQFGLQISQSPLEFSAFGISLNYNVISSCLKIVTTYLVIVIQMSNTIELTKNTQQSGSK